MMIVIFFVLYPDVSTGQGAEAEGLSPNVS